MLKALLLKIRQVPIGSLRLGVQLGIGMICAWMGVKFYLFVKFLESGGTGTPATRPPGAEGFLPISSLMSIYHTLKTGTMESLHPAGMVILLAALLMSFVVAKSFCGWICPIGFLSDLLEKLRHRLFGPKSKVEGPWGVVRTIVDGMMRSIKYVLLGFFFYAIIGMSTAGLNSFLNSDYNTVADVKMYHFFATISLRATVIIAILTLLTFFIPRFWCRYLCPYGALTGIVGLLSPLKIRRDEATCIDCGDCTRACPSRITVETVKAVHSDECISCYQCIAACPVKGALELRAPKTTKPVSIRLSACIAICIFLGSIGMAKLIGFWHNDVPISKYLKLHKEIDELGHPRSPKSLRQLDE
jgi:NAD-dependent dihydropyrimidine dehydrogenase PreA subunit